MSGGTAYPWFVRKDLDGFFGLAIDNLIQLMIIVPLSGMVAGIPNEIIFGYVLPGAAISIISGNIFYSIQARRLAMRTGRSDVTALPYGINTVSLFAYIFFIMGPVYQETKDPVFAWKIGLVACLFSGIIETLGAFAGGWIRRVTPRAALLSTLAGIAITFISMDFTFQIFAKPAIALIPMAIILFYYMSHVRLPGGLPGGLFAVMIGTAIAWGLRLSGVNGYFDPDWGKSLEVSVHLPVPVIGTVLGLVGDPHVWKYMAVIIPMGLFNVVGSLQNLESAEAAGDKYETAPSLFANGLGSILAAFLGSCFPTTIYIGHPGWKALGARTGYSILNGLFIAFICLTGTMDAVLRFIPLEAGVGILLWIGIIIAAQAFQETPRHHALAVALGIVPALAAWGLLMVESGLRAAGTNLYNTVTSGSFQGIMPIQGTIALSQGFIFTSMILAAMSVYVIERVYWKASLWALTASIMSYFGVIHAYSLTGAGIAYNFKTGAATEFAICYAAVAIFLLILQVRDKKA
ncbi:MAG: NCS2 family permease [Nitrospirae bacterium]|nr:NCS2 family permease [Nitrospirota bacterium]